MQFRLIFWRKAPIVAPLAVAKGGQGLDESLVPDSKAQSNFIVLLEKFAKKAPIEGFFWRF